MKIKTFPKLAKIKQLDEKFVIVEKQELNDLLIEFDDQINWLKYCEKLFNKIHDMTDPI